MFKSAATAMIPSGEKVDAANSEKDELAKLRQQMADMQRRLDALSR